MVSGRLGTVLATGTRLFRAAALARGCGVCGLSLVLQTPLPPGSHRCPVNWPVGRKAEDAHLCQCAGMSPERDGDAT
jgi:hypothetical protein